MQILAYPGEMLMTVGERESLEPGGAGNETC